MNKQGKGNNKIGSVLLILLLAGAGYYFFIYNNGANNPFGSKNYEPKWQCTPWSTCDTKGIQYRTCTDLNKIFQNPTDLNKDYGIGYPAIKKPCEIGDCPVGMILCQSGGGLVGNSIDYLNRYCRKSCCEFGAKDFNACYDRDIWRFRGCTGEILSKVKECPNDSCSVNTNECL